MKKGNSLLANYREQVDLLQGEGKVEDNYHNLDFDLIEDLHQVV
jgi:hypothetical protein